MSNLQAAAEQKTAERNAKLQAAASKPRLVADPNIAVGDIQSALEAWCTFKASKNLWGTVCPPIEGPAVFSFKTRPRGPWLAKTMGLLFDLLIIAPNTKLSSMKLKSAVSNMIETKVISNATTKNTQDFIDMIDTTIRVLLGMIRDTFVDSEKKATVVKYLSVRQQGELSCLLGKVRLPKEFINEEEGEGDDKPIYSPERVKRTSSQVDLTDSVDEAFLGNNPMSLQWEMPPGDDKPPPVGDASRILSWEKVLKDVMVTSAASNMSVDENISREQCEVIAIGDDSDDEDKLLREANAYECAGLAIAGKKVRNKPATKKVAKAPKVAVMKKPAGAGKGAKATPQAAPFAHPHPVPKVL